MPFATQCFWEFGRRPKPQLKTLTLGTANTWEWTSYRNSMDVMTTMAFYLHGYAASATKLHTVFEACPRLKELTIISNALTASDVTVLLNPAIFSDAFWEQLARCCPLLETLVVRQNALRDSDLMVVTDPTLHALASLSGLHSVSMESVIVPGDGLFDLVVNHAAETRHERTYRTHTGTRGNRRRTQDAFYAALETFLRRLADCKDTEQPCASLRVVLYFESQNTIVDKSRSVQDFKRLQNIAEKARVQHPLQGIVDNYDDERKSFGKISRFTFANQPIPHEERHRDQYAFEKMDEVFVSQRWGWQRGNEVDYFDRRDDYDPPTMTTMITSSPQAHDTQTTYGSRNHGRAFAYSVAAALHFEWDFACVIDR